jgi:hypothetical protein
LDKRLKRYDVIFGAKNATANVMRHLRTALKYGGDITDDQVMELQPFEWADEQFIASPAMIRTSIGCQLTKISRHFRFMFPAGVLGSIQSSEGYELHLSGYWGGANQSRRRAYSVFIDQSLKSFFIHK